MAHFKEQIQHFTNRLNFHLKPTIPFNPPNNWLGVFHMLSLYFEEEDLKEKIVLFFEELPWIASRKSGFLKETENYFKSRSINLDLFHIIQLYMAMGGIPHYLKEIEEGQSAAENIDRIFFSKNGLLNEELGFSHKNAIYRF